MSSSKSDEAKAEHVNDFRKNIGALREEIGKVIVGHREVVDGVITCVLASSHALLEGVPGLGKTMLVRTIADAMDLSFSRVQFTPDLMPADIIGTTVIEETSSGHRTFSFRKGPIFSNIVLADEINRATPKTQSALLEAMQAQRVTVSRTSHELEPPFFVLATQNPLESEGTYPLPEAQLDRFFFKLHITFPTSEDLHAILDRTTGTTQAKATRVITKSVLLSMQGLVREVPLSRPVQDYVVRLLQATHPGGKETPPDVNRYVKFGASPRGAQALLMAGKIRALLEGRFAVSHEDIRAAVLPALRHRVLLNFEGEAEGMRTDDLLAKVVESVKVTS